MAATQDVDGLRASVDLAKQRKRDALQKWRAENKDKMRAQHRAWRARNKEYLAAKTKRYHSSAEYLAKRRALRQTEQEREKRGAYLARPEVRQRTRALQKVRRARALTSVDERLTNQLRVLINRALKRKYDHKSWRDFIDYDIAQLRRHLERQFQEGMTWENRGRAWHIDHIVPIAELRGDIRACWALTNLRPLWARDNMLKGDKRIFLL